MRWKYVLPTLYLALALYAWIDFTRTAHDGLANLGLMLVTLPVTALGLVIADKDINQIPRFHAEAVLAACAPRCEIVMRLPEGGHGAMLSPMPPLEPGSVAQRLLSDPPDFDRGRLVPELNARIADFFVRTLTAAP